MARQGTSKISLAGDVGAEALVDAVMWEEAAGGDAGPLLLQVDYAVSDITGQSGLPPNAPLPASLNGLSPAGQVYNAGAWGSALPASLPVAAQLVIELTSRAVKTSFRADLAPGTYVLPAADVVRVGVAMLRLRELAGGAKDGWVQARLSRGHYSQAQRLWFSDLAYFAGDGLIDVTREFVRQPYCRELYPVIQQLSAVVSAQLPSWRVSGGYLGAGSGGIAQAQLDARVRSPAGRGLVGRFTAQALAGAAYLIGATWVVEP